ncbi:glycoside hydrolase family 16 protein [Sphingomonas sp. RS6]
MLILTALLLQTTTLGDTSYKVDVPMSAPSTAPTRADEFDAPKVDTSIWRYETERNAQGWFNNEKQYYSAGRPENARIENGALVIEARREALKDAGLPDWGGQAYSSARLISREGFGYGFYEIRAKLPCGRGSWPAIWMLPDSGQWPEMGEIDIMEMVGWDPNMVHATLHTGLYNHSRGTQRGAQIAIPTACTEFHRYQMRWTPQEIVIGVDGRGYMRVANDRPGGAGAWPFTRPFHMILNVAVGGDWGGAKGIDDAALPQRMTIDYVRYWAVPDEASAPVSASRARPAR